MRPPATMGLAATATVGGSGGSARPAGQRRTSSICSLRQLPGGVVASVRRPAFPELAERVGAMADANAVMRGFYGGRAEAVAGGA